MTYIKRITNIMLSWCLEVLNKDMDDEPQDKDKKIDFAVGGQAVIEGVMMRSPNHISIAVRKPKGDIKVQNKQYKTLTQRYKWLNVPILRGVINLFEMMKIGTEAINFSAAESIEEIEKEEKAKKKKKKRKPLLSKKSREKLTKVGDGLMFALSFVIALALSIFLFKFLPLWTTTYLESKSSAIADNYILFNFIDGVLKSLVFLSYIFLLSLIPSFRRVFEYHGAEHKSIYTYEKKLPLEIENAKKQTRFHPRCGTSFILIVFIISIIVYTFVPKHEVFHINLAIRIAFLPLIAGISYEYLKLSAKHTDKWFVKALVAPGLWFQKLTTKEPDSKQLEVGLRSLKESLAAEGVNEPQRSQTKCRVVPQVP